MKKLVICLIVLWISIVAESVVFAQDEDKHQPFFESISFGFQFGKDQLLPDSLKGKHSRNTVWRYLIQGENKTILPEPYSFVLEGHYSKHKADEHPDDGQDTGMQEIGANLWLKREFFRERWYDFYCMIGGGFSYVLKFPNFENRDWDKMDMKSDIARSHFLGTFGGAFGKEFDISFLADNWSATTEVRLTHTSDPFGPDFGKNYGVFQIMLKYRF